MTHADKGTNVGSSIWMIFVSGLMLWLPFVGPLLRRSVGVGDEQSRLKLSA